jgi:hypothetical protein
LQIAAHVLDTWKSPMWCAMKLARGLKTVMSRPRSCISRNWLASIDSRNSSSPMRSSEACGICAGFPMPAICRLRHASSAFGAVV